MTPHLPAVFIQLVFFCIATVDKKIQPWTEFFSGLDRVHYGVHHRVHYFFLDFEVLGCQSAISILFLPKDFKVSFCRFFHLKLSISSLGRTTKYEYLPFLVIRPVA